MATISFQGKECKLERVGIYVKRGAYTHGLVKGWQLVDMDGNIIISGQPGQPRFAEEYQKPRYETKKSLLSAIEDQQEWWERRQRKLEASNG